MHNLKYFHLVHFLLFISINRTFICCLLLISQEDTFLHAYINRKLNVHHYNEGL